MANYSGRDGSAYVGTVAATGVLTLTGQPLDTQTVTIGSKVYTFQTVLTNVDGNVLIGASASASLDNLIAAITLGLGAGTLYATATTLHPTVTAAAGAGDTMDATAQAKGSGGNSLATTETLTNGSWGNATLTGGAEASIGELLLWELTLDDELIEDTVKGDSLRTFVPDLAGGRATITAHLDYGDTAQASLVDAINSGAPPLIACKLRIAGTTKEFLVNGFATGYSTGSPEGGARDRITFSVALASLPTVTWT